MADIDYDELPSDDIPDEEDEDVLDEGSIDQVFHAMLLEFQAEKNADIFVISGAITTKLADEVIAELRYNLHKMENAVVFLCTYGGDGDAAYRIARAFKKYYTRFSVYVAGYCKSAGSMIALGADEVIISPKGELGPLDIQLPKEDNFVFFSSGLDVSYALGQLENQAFSIFENAFLNIIRGSGGSITTKTAATIATELSVGLLSPITSQIDPLRIGETQRAVEIAFEYGLRLGADRDKLHHLIYHYPSHSFVIDVEEAKDIFKGVREFTFEEDMVEVRVMTLVKESKQHESLRTPHPHGIVVHLDLVQESDESEEQEQEHEQNEDADSEVANSPITEAVSSQQSSNGASSEGEETPS